MSKQNFRNRSVDPSHFAMVPRGDVPRSIFQMDHGHKTTFDAGYLVPVYLQEILPGDSLSVNMTAFVRMATPVYPIMDNLHLTSFFFFVPNRLVWNNWQKFMGERSPDPDSSTDYVVPTIPLPANSNACTLQDYMGLPCGATVASNINVNALPFRMYNLIWNEWFRDQNLQDSVVVDRDDGPDSMSDYVLLRRGKRHDYFTSCLPWPQKGDATIVPLGGEAPVRGLYIDNISPVGSNGSGYKVYGATGASTIPYYRETAVGSTYNTSVMVEMDGSPGYPKVFADLSTQAALTVNTLRQSFQIQKLLERDARGGTRYVEILRSHFGVISPDARLQRPEYLGGGQSPIGVNAIPQTSATGASGTPQGNLAATAQGVAQHGFRKSFVEHGYVLGLVHVRADLTYHQGVPRHWRRSTRYDYYWPAFAHLGEQAVRRQEIYATGNANNDEVVFGYQERYGELRYKPSQITGYFRPSAPGSLDVWHLAQNFSGAPVLGSDFIKDEPPVVRVVAAGSAADGQQFLFDSVFETRAVRPLPMYGVPGFIDRL